MTSRVLTTAQPVPRGEFLLYQTDDGKTRIQCRFIDETIWLTQALIAELFQVHVMTVNEHLRTIYEDGEIERRATIRKFLIVRSEGKRRVSREIEHYNLEAILAVGYRVRSDRGTQFRQWATARLNEYLVKGFTMDDERLKNPPGKGHKDYFDELLDRIRDIRSSERRFYQKVLDIYATSIDYSPDAEISEAFFAAVQNKMHWAAHGNTAAEVVHARVDGTKPQAGMTTWVGARPNKAGAVIAKNYLSPEELNALNRIVVAYLEFAEVQALSRRPMYMRDWIAKLDDFLRLSGRGILTHAGKVSHEDALRKAELEFERFHRRQLAQPSRVERDFDAAVKGLKQLPGKRPTRKGK